jgi:hypothetical protein
MNQGNKYTIKNPEYIDLEKTRVRFVMVLEDGKEQIAEFKVPDGQRRGKNKAWDRIMDEFDIEDMRQRRNNREIEERNRINHRREKEKADVERHRLRNLFNSKTKAFELPFIKDADIDTKAAIRRAGTHELLYFFINDITRKFIEDNKMTYSEYLDYLDDLEDEAD